MILCIDTATECAGIALADGKKCHAYLPLETAHHAEQILPTINKALKTAKANLNALAGVLVIKGPGSFTSLRVGIAVANQFAHQLKIPIVGLRTDEWWMHRTDERPVVYLQSMNREEVYTRVILSASEESPQLLKISDLVMGEILRYFVPQNDIGYLGQLSDEHRAKLPPDWHEVAKLKSPADTWAVAAHAFADQLQNHKAYALVDPFYGKEPTITKSKQQLGLKI